jgi:hypothetical protein
MVSRFLLMAACAAAIAGCARRESQEPAAEEPLTIEQMRDTTGLSEGRALMRSFEPYRMDNGVIRVRGRLAFPDGTVGQLSIFPAGSKDMITRVQFVVENGRFDTPPIIGGSGPLPRGRYHFTVVSYFDSSMQPPEVLEETRDGRILRGPGITRSIHGGAAFSYAGDHTL